MTELNHLALAKLIADGTLMSISEFANKFRTTFLEAGFSNKSGDVDIRKIANYYSTEYEGLIKVNSKDNDDKGKSLKAIQYQTSSAEKLEEIYTSARTHVVTLMNANDKTLVPTDNFTGDCPLVGSHSIPLRERVIFASSNAADTPAMKLLKRASTDHGNYPLPDGISVNDLPESLRKQIEHIKHSVSNSGKKDRPVKASSTAQLLIPCDGSYIAVQPADSPVMIEAFTESIKARVNVQIEGYQNKKINTDAIVPDVPFHTEMLKGVSKKQNLGVQIPNAPYILVAIPPFSNADISECLLISNNFQNWLDKKIAWKASRDIETLSRTRKCIEGKDSTNSNDRREQSALLQQITMHVKTQLRRIQSFDISEGFLSDSLAEGKENWDWIADELVQWLNHAVASDSAIFAVTKEESDRWKSEIYDQLMNNKVIK